MAIDSPERPSAGRQRRVRSGTSPFPRGISDMDLRRAADYLLFRTWWTYRPANRSWFEIPYHAFNLFEGVVWVILLMPRALSFPAMPPLARRGRLCLGLLHVRPDGFPGGVCPPVLVDLAQGGQPPGPALAPRPGHQTLLPREQIVLKPSAGHPGQVDPIECRSNLVVCRKGNPLGRLFAGTPWDRPPTCDRCGQPEAECTCPPPVVEPVRLAPETQTARLRLEKRPKGKVVTTVGGLDPAGTDLEDLATRLKTRCGTGGTLKQGTIELQGDHLAAAEVVLKALGFKTKSRR